MRSRTHTRDSAVHVTTLAALLAETARAARETESSRVQQLKFFEPADPLSVPLYCSGETALLRKPCVAVVGTRTPSGSGRARARRLARELAGEGVVIVSGLARGIDTDALTAALTAGGRVIGVIGTPLDTAYPAENKQLQERIARDHLVVSQFAPGHPVRRHNFPMRNRLMAALADATVIIEAGDHSGTLHQAAECVRLDRWLFIAQALVGERTLKWPAKFLIEPQVLPLRSSADVLSALRKRR